MTRIVLDTGPIVAFLNKRDRFFNWANAAFKLCDLTRVSRFGLFFSVSKHFFRLGFFTKGRLTNRKNMSIIYDQS